MNLEQEQIKLIKIIRIPITDIKFSAGYCNLYNENHMIGVLPTFEIKGILHYDTNEDSLSKLDWKNIYLDNRDLLTEKIKDSLDIKEIKVTIGTFRRLYVRDFKDNLIGAFECIYENDSWRVDKEE
ncbi:hypothetical protein [Indibacter alkaliphilus]|nr:hypothetical protein [Indibacter alkaliphilus]